MEHTQIIIYHCRILKKLLKDWHKVYKVKKKDEVNKNKIIKNINGPVVCEILQMISPHYLNKGIKNIQKSFSASVFT